MYFLTIGFNVFGINRDSKSLSLARGLARLNAAISFNLHLCFQNWFEYSALLYGLKEKFWYVEEPENPAK